MDPVSDTFLVSLAEIAAGLTGLFLVGMIFYIQTGYDRIERSRKVVEPYFRAATTVTFIAYAIPLFVSLTLVALPIGWSRLLFLILVLGLVVADVSTVTTVRTVRRATRLGLLTMMEVVGTAVVALMVILPLATGGLSPDREDLVPALLLSLAVAFLGTCVLVLTLFDISRLERSEAARAEPELPERTADATGSTDEAPSGQDTDPLD